MGECLFVDCHCHSRDAAGGRVEGQGGFGWKLGIG